MILLTNGINFPDNTIPLKYHKLNHIKGGRLKCRNNEVSNFIMARDFQLLRLKDVINLTTLSKSTIYRRRSLGLFPKNINSGGIALWRNKDITSWISAI